jgi:hypothetical protein
MRKQSLLFRFAAVLVMALGASQAAGASDIAAPAQVSRAENAVAPARVDGGRGDSGDLARRSTGVCRAEYDPRGKKRVYACEFKTSDACVVVGAVDVPASMSVGGSQRRYLCPAPNR